MRQRIETLAGTPAAVWRVGEPSAVGPLLLQVNTLCCVRRPIRVLLLAAILNFQAAVLGSNFSLPAVSGDTNRLDMGAFAEGTVLTIQMSGQMDLGNTWRTMPDGSLASAVTDTNYFYVNVGSTNYPKDGGGDGINHFVGGGGNYDAISFSYGIAGLRTTDTANPLAIRFGAVVGTFNAAPARGDWFFVGTSNQVTIPAGGAHLYLALNDAYYPNNVGDYAGVLTVQQPQQPPQTISLTISRPAIGAVNLSWSSTPGLNYQLEYSTNAGTTNWTNLGPAITATNTTTTYSDSITNGQRLYRVQLTP